MRSHAASDASSRAGAVGGAPRSRPGDGRRFESRDKGAGDFEDARERMSLSERLNQAQITDDAPVGCAGNRFVCLLAASAAAMFVCDVAMLDSLYP